MFEKREIAIFPSLLIVIQPSCGTLQVGFAGFISSVASCIIELSIAECPLSAA